MKLIAIDIGGTFTKWAVLDENLSIIKKGKFETHALTIKMTKVFESVAEKVVYLNKKYNDIIGVGISLPGIINSKTSEILIESHNLPKSQGLCIKEEMKKYFDLPVEVINEAAAAALWESKNGEMKKYGSGILITIGAGIGMGIIIDGKIYEGSSFAAGQVGRQNIDGRMWEYSSSTRALIRNVKLFLGTNNLTGEEVLNLIKKDKIIKGIFNRWLNYISIGISNIINILDPEIVVIGGGISENEIFDIEVIKKKISFRLNNNTKAKEIKIVKTSKGADSQLYGVAKFFMDKN